MSENLPSDQSLVENDRPNFVVRHAEPNDAAAIHKVYKETWLATYPAAELGVTHQDILSHAGNWDAEESVRRTREALADPEPDFIEMVAEDGNQVIATSRLQISQNENRLYGFYVLPAYHGSGAAQALMRQTLAQADSNNPTSLEVTSHTPRAIAFYRKMGFVIDDHAGPVVRTLNNGKIMPGYRMVRPAGMPLP